MKQTVRGTTFAAVRIESSRTKLGFSRIIFFRGIFVHSRMSERAAFFSSKTEMWASSYGWVFFISESLNYSSSCYYTSSAVSVLCLCMLAKSTLTLIKTWRNFYLIWGSLIEVHTKFLFDLEKFFLFRVLVVESPSSLLQTLIYKTNHPWHIKKPSKNFFINFLSLANHLKLF